jgi:hypothetical protein
MHMVFKQMPFFDSALLLPRKLVQYFAQMGTQPCEQLFLSDIFPE